MFGYNIHNVTVIKDNIKSSLNKCGIKAQVQLENNNKVISAYNKFDSLHPEHLYLWIRLLPYGSTGKYIADISNIILPNSKRGCGTFQIIYNRLKRCKYVEKIRIISPCTDSMYKWIKKNKPKECEPSIFV